MLAVSLLGVGVKTELTVILQLSLCLGQQLRYVNDEGCQDVSSACRACQERGMKIDRYGQGKGICFLLMAVGNRSRHSETSRMVSGVLDATKDRILVRVTTETSNMYQARKSSASVS